MKRVLLCIVICIMLMTLCACRGNTLAPMDLKAIVPQQISPDPAEYPMLQQAPPPADRFLGDAPRTFVFRESQWEKAPAKNGMETYTNGGGETLYCDAEMNSYMIERGTMNPDLSVSEDYRLLTYDENGNLEYFRSGQYAFYFETSLSDAPEPWAAAVYDGKDLYQYSLDTATGEVYEIQANILAEVPGGHTQLAFCYDPAEKTVAFTSFSFSVKEGSGYAEYDAGGDLKNILYYPAASPDICYTYTGDYQRTDDISVN